MASVLERIFSIREDKLRYIVTFLGIKMKFPKKKYNDMRKAHPYYYYKQNNLDITTVPPATGAFREFQLATLAVLIDFDTICKQNNIRYWLDFGTLIGAIRHRGFIPWDDDIDLGIFRKDYERIMNVVNNNTVNPDICAEYNTTGNFIKIKHRKSDLLFIDLFPVDTYGEIIPLEEQLKETKRIKKILTPIHVSQTSEDDFKQKRKLIAKIIEEDIITNKIPTDETKVQYVWGGDFLHDWKNWFTNYDVYFPFKTILFEGYEFPCMNNPDDYLKKVYGDYMAYPKKCVLVIMFL